MEAPYAVYYTKNCCKVLQRKSNVMCTPRFRYRYSYLSPLGGLNIRYGGYAMCVMRNFTLFCG